MVKENQARLLSGECGLDEGTAVQRRQGLSGCGRLQNEECTGGVHCGVLLQHSGSVETVV